MSRSRAARFLATGYAVGHLLLGVLLAVLVTIGIAGFALTIVGIGPVLLRPWVSAVSAQAQLYARMGASFLGRPVPVDVPAVSGKNPWSQLSEWAGQRRFWQLILWILFAATVGIVLSALAAALPFGVIALTVLAIVFAASGLSSHVLLVTVLASCAIVAALVWWFLGNVFLEWRCGIEAAILEPDANALLEQRVADLTASRADTVDASAAELRRIERDLHDGAQARLVALGMNLGMAADLLEQNPQLARQLLQEARESTGAALGDLRSVVRGIHPPVLADRGLVGAVQALALDMAIPVTVDAALPARPPAPIESAVYFAVAECLANVAKHARAENAWIVIAASGSTLRAVVGDDGRGGADLHAGTGLRGIARRLGTFDGTMDLSSPIGGPTVVTLEVPCVWSSPRTTPSSVTG
ncbi:MAG: histidine kinase [Tetrasphaera sp.]